MHRRWLLSAGIAVFVVALLLRRRGAGPGRDGEPRHAEGVDRATSTAD